MQKPAPHAPQPSQTPETLRALLAFKKLTSREIDIVSFVLRGFSNKQIQEELHIGRGGVTIQLTSIYKKLRVSSRTQLVIYCFGLILTARQKSFVFNSNPTHTETHTETHTHTETDSGLDF